MNLPLSVCCYFCGGAAINIGKILKNEFQNEREFNATFIDTSDSNQRENDLGDKFYKVNRPIDDNSGKRVDGSGKIRKTNYQAIRSELQAILHAHKPADFNIVIHSSGGGSGSVIGPLLVSQLLAQDRAVVVIMVGSTTCVRELSNTIDTIESYQGIIEKHGQPVNAFYFENGRTGNKDENNSRVIISLLTLFAFWSGENHGLDRSDLDNFLNYHRVSKFSPGFTYLDLCNGHAVATAIQQLPDTQAISSVVTLVSKGQDPEPGIRVQYHAYGEIPETTLTGTHIQFPIHLYGIHGFFSDLTNRLRSDLGEVDEYHNVKVGQIGQVKVQKDALDDGMVL